jgi:hypothetical protein
LSPAVVLPVERTRAAKPSRPGMRFFTLPRTWRGE